MNRLRHWLGAKLQRKLLRDLAFSRGLFLAVIVVIFLGVALFEASFLGYRNLKSSYDYSYETLRFADLTVKVVEAPPDAADALESIPGIQAVYGRLNSDLGLTLPGKDGKRVLARVISLPSGSRAPVNDVKVEEGEYFRQGETDALLVEKSFAEHHGLTPGDSLRLMADGQEAGFRLAGIVTSPEYIWPAKSRQELLVSPETFGVFFVPEETVALVMGEPVVNEFCFLFDEQADKEALGAQVEDALAPYVVMDAVTADEQPSNAALQMDLQEFGEMAEVFPLMFLLVGALATYILLTRIVHNQRSQIGLMRAVGYSRRQVLLHYVSFGLTIGVVGSLLGVLAGYLLSGAVTTLYVGMLGLPYTSTSMGWMEWLAIEEGLLLGVLPCFVAGIIPALAASRIAPAEAMRTPPPASGRKLLLERVFPFLTRLSSLWKLPLRNIFRNRRRSLYTIIGVAFGVSLILVSAAFVDSIDYMLDLQFNRIQRYDAQISFVEPQPASLVDDVSSWGETEVVEGVLQVPARLEWRGEAYSTIAVGLQPGSELYGLHSIDGERVVPGDDGILLSEGLRGTLGVEVGDTVAVRSPIGLERLEVSGFVKQPMGSFGYVTLERAQALVGGQPVVSGLMVDVEPGHSDSIRERAYQIPGTASVELTSESQDQVNELMGLLRVMMWVMLGFGAALSLAIVFTTVTVSVLERRREIATMRTLGEGKGRIAAMLTIENLALGLVGLLPGLLLGYGLALLFFSLVESDMMTFDLVVFPRTYLLAAGMVVLIMLLSQVPGIRHLNRLNLAMVTKEQAT
jgi:putative ABC transport system permease protein